MMRVTYVNHSGFFVELEDACFLFDYYHGKIPEDLADKKCYVFSSHAHFDHYTKKIFRLRERFSKVYYILSSDIRTQESELVYKVDPQEELELEGCHIRTLKSTDEGVAYLLQYKNKTIYHAGDLNWWHWEEEGDDFNLPMGEAYRSAIDSLGRQKIDLAFVPTDLRLEDAYFWGIRYFLEHTDTRYVFPMHFWDEYEVFDRLRHQPELEPYREQIMMIQSDEQTFELER